MTRLRTQSSELSAEATALLQDVLTPSISSSDVIDLTPPTSERKEDTCYSVCFSVYFTAWDDPLAAVVMPLQTYALGLFVLGLYFMSVMCFMTYPRIPSRVHVYPQIPMVFTSTQRVDWVNMGYGVLPNVVLKDLMLISQPKESVLLPTDECKLFIKLNPNNLSEALIADSQQSTFRSFYVLNQSSAAPQAGIDYYFDMLRVLYKDTFEGCHCTSKAYESFLDASCFAEPYRLQVVHQEKITCFVPFHQTFYKTPQTSDPHLRRYNSFASSMGWVGKARVQISTHNISVSKEVYHTDPSEWFDTTAYELGKEVENDICTLQNRNPHVTFK